MIRGAQVERVPLWMNAPPAVRSGGVSFAAGFTPVARAVLPAVVNISSSRVVRQMDPFSPFTAPGES